MDDGVQKIRPILGRNPDKSRNTYKNDVLIINLVYFYRAQPCTIINVFNKRFFVFRLLSGFLPKMVLICWTPSRIKKHRCNQDSDCLKLLAGWFISYFRFFGGGFRDGF